MVCGYVHEGVEAPEVCPKCSYAKEKFAELSSEDAEKIYSSDRTNSIHAEMIILADKIAKLAKEGIEINFFINSSLLHLIYLTFFNVCLLCLYINLNNIFCQ